MSQFVQLWRCRELLHTDAHQGIKSVRRQPERQRQREKIRRQGHSGGKSGSPGIIYSLGCCLYLGAGLGFGLPCSSTLWRSRMVPDYHVSVVYLRFCFDSWCLYEREGPSDTVAKATMNPVWLFWLWYLNSPPINLNMSPVLPSLSLLLNPFFLKKKITPFHIRDRDKEPPTLFKFTKSHVRFSSHWDGGLEKWLM